MMNKELEQKRYKTSGILFQTITCPDFLSFYEKVCSKFQVDQYNCNNNAGVETGFFILQIC